MSAGLDDFFDAVSFDSEEINAALEQLGVGSDETLDEQSLLENPLTDNERAELDRVLGTQSGDGNDNNAARSVLEDFGSETLRDDRSDSKTLRDKSAGGRDRARRSIYYDSDEDIDDRLLPAANSFNSERNDNNAFGRAAESRSVGESTLEGSYNVLPALDDEGAPRDDATLVDRPGRRFDGAGSSSGGFRSFDFETKQLKYTTLDRQRIVMLWNDDIRSAARMFGMLAGNSALVLYAGDIKAVSQTDVVSQGRVVALLDSTKRERDRARELIELIDERFLAEPESQVAKRKKELMDECIEAATLIALGMPISLGDTEAALVLRAVGRKIDVEYEQLDLEFEEQEVALNDVKAVISNKAKAEAKRDKEVAKIDKRLAKKEAELEDLRLRYELKRRVGPIKAQTPGANFDLTDEQRFDRAQAFNMNSQRQTVTEIGELKQKRTKAQNSKSLRKAQRAYNDTLDVLNQNPPARDFLKYCDEAEKILNTLPQRLLALRTKFLQAEAQITNFAVGDEQQTTTKQRAKIRQPGFA